MKRYLFCYILLLFIRTSAHAQDEYSDRAQRYAEQYAGMAIEEQQKSGIPAAITLGQGILETEAGASELMTKANNHFGIKCKSDWLGDKILHTDDAPNECFKRYKCAQDSYRDHSDYLKRNPRYTPLFSIKLTDYQAWAVCLRKCGYATNPQYAQNLVKIIETFNLERYTLMALDSSFLNTQPLVVDDSDVDEVTVTTPTIQHTADSARNFITHPKDNTPPAATEPAVDNSKIVTVNGMKTFYAQKGESLRSYAIKYKVSYSHLLEMNDLPDAPLAFNMPVYLEKKQTLGAKPTHIVTAGETMLLVSQLEGVQLKKLLAMNMLNPNEQPVTGTVLYLQSATAIKPDVVGSPVVAHKTNAIVTGADTTAKQDNDYIVIKHTEPAAKPVAKPPVPVHVDTVVTPKSAPVVAVKATPVPQPHIDTPKEPQYKPKHVIVVKTETEAPKKQESVTAYVPQKPAAPVEKTDTASLEDLTNLKNELDKVVYADDSRLLENNDNANKKAATQAAKTESYYTVRRGDTATSIARRNKITVNELLKLNKISASGIKAGKTLRVK